MTPVPPYFFIVVVCLVSAVCQDDPTVNCTKYKPQCSDFHYNDLMNKYCPKTCDKCEPATTCQDAADQSVLNNQQESPPN
ncbi:shTK domain protein [Necator americanus]|uniref:ShTK domain protein n=1 Tax=Necator americanus TaxID=51031 RepID=W2TY82_NECAM|nr:shTK domain protein [Necator americanus]ETN86011.1 shTK domain protein [Necator americanus]